MPTAPLDADETRTLMPMDRRSFIKCSGSTAAAVTATLTVHEDGKESIAGLDISVLRLKPGDVLILRAPGRITADTAARLKDYVERALAPMDVKAFIFGDGLRVDGILRSGD